MGTNPYLSDMLTAEHRQQIQREAEQRRLIAQLCPQKKGAGRVGRRAVWKMGKALVLLGLWLEQIDQIEQGEQPALS